MFNRLVLFLICALVACRSDPCLSDRQQEQKEEVTVRLHNMYYLKLPNTDYCVAYNWAGDWHGGPIVILLPSCDGILVESK